MPDWFPSQKQELVRMLDSFLLSTQSSKNNKKQKDIHGLIVPHAGYAYSGKIAGKAFSLLKNEDKIKEQQKEYRAENKDKIKKHGIKYYSENKDNSCWPGILKLQQVQTGTNSRLWKTN